MNEIEFKAGDCVELKSGGPLMTIKDVSKFRPPVVEALCVWFDGKKKKEELFGLETLKPKGNGCVVFINTDNTEPQNYTIIE